MFPSAAVSSAETAGPGFRRARLRDGAVALRASCACGAAVRPVPAEGDRGAAVVVGVDLLEQDGGAGGLRDRGRQDRGPVCGGAGIVLPVRPAGRQEAASQLPPVQAVGERDVPRLGTRPLPGTAMRPDGRLGQERRMYVLALDRNRQRGRTRPAITRTGSAWTPRVPSGTPTSATSTVVRVREGGAVLATVELDRGAFACALSRGADPRLFVVGQVYGGPELGQPSGRVVAFPAPAPGAGRP